MTGARLWTAIGGAIALTAAALTGVVPVSAEPQRSLPHVGEYSAAQFAGAAASAPADLATALKDQLGISVAEFYAEGAAGAAADATLSGLRDAGVDVLGSHLDGTELVVNVASTQDAAIVTQAGATAALGAPAKTPSPASMHTMSDPELATGLHGGAGWSVPDSTDPTSDWLCSVGFNGIDAITGAHEFLTAGHCASNAASPATASTLGTDVRDACTSNCMTSPTPTSPTKLGTVITANTQFGSNIDAGLVRLNAGIQQQADVTTWGDTSPFDGTTAPNAIMGTSTLPITGTAPAIAGAVVCHSGYRTGWQCGHVSYVDSAATRHPISVSGKAVNSIVTDICVNEGDSGGGLVMGKFAVGILSGGNAIDDNSSPTQACAGPAAPGTESVYFPLISIATNYDVAHFLPNWELLTTTGPIRLNPRVTLVPATIAGTIQVGKTVSTRLPAWNPAADLKTIKVQWLLDGKPIARQTTASLAITPAMGGHRLSLRITASRTNYTPTAVTSRAYAVALAKLTAMPAPTIVGPKQVGHTLSARAGTWKPGGVRLHYQWYANGHPIKGAAGRTLKLTVALRGRTIQVRVTGTKTGYVSHYSTSKKTPRIA